VPAPGDYDGDGKTDLAFYRPSTFQWIVLFSSSGFTSSMTMAWGAPLDIPVPGDFDGDGKIDLTVYRASAGTWYGLQSTFAYMSQSGVVWGGVTETPLAADYDGDGKDDYVVFQNGVWKVLFSSTNFSTSMTVSLGGAADIALPHHP
jgi:membrane-bound lytic murein transglycosylase B